MKKTIIMIVLIVTPVLSFAQLKVASNGKVAIGTLDSPSSTLSVGGIGAPRYKAYIHGNTKVNGNLNVNKINLKLDPVGNNITCFNIVNILELINQLNPYYYSPLYSYPTSQTDVSSHPDPEAGTIPFFLPYSINGSDIHNIFPTIATKDENNEYVIDQGQLIVVLIQAIKELKAKVDALSPSGNNLIMAPMQQLTDNNTDELSTSDISPTHLSKAALFQNSPNPFNERTTIHFNIPENSPAAYIYIFDMTGKMQKQIHVDSSMQSVSINGYELSPGMYIYSLVIGGKEVDTKRMIVTK